jgi:hypothetical protein
LGLYLCLLRFALCLLTCSSTDTLTGAGNRPCRLANRCGLG